MKYLWNLKTGRAWAIKETLRHLWDYQRKGWALPYWKDWYFWATHSRLKPVVKVAKMIQAHLDNVLTGPTVQRRGKAGGSRMRKKTSPSDLKVGDRIRIIKLPGEGIPGYYLHPHTMRVFKKLIARGQSVRIARIDEYGSPWYTCRFRMKSGLWEWHDLAVFDRDNNWVRVTPRNADPIASLENQRPRSKLTTLPRRG